MSRKTSRIITAIGCITLLGALTGCTTIAGQAADEHKTTHSSVSASTVTSLQKQVAALAKRVDNVKAEADENGRDIGFGNDVDNWNARASAIHETNTEGDVQAIKEELAKLAPVAAAYPDLSAKVAALSKETAALSAEVAKVEANPGTTTKVVEHDTQLVQGQPGSTGATGTAGVGIASTTVNAAGDLIVTLTDGTTQDAGLVKGADGAAGQSITGPAGPQGAAGNANLAAEVTVTASGTGAARAECPAGDSLLSGGFALGSGVTLQASYPYPGMQAWAAQASGAGPVVAYAVCAPTN